MFEKSKKILSAINTKDYKRLKSELETAQDFDCSDITITLDRIGGYDDDFSLFQWAMYSHDGSVQFDEILVEISRIKGVNALESFRDSNAKRYNFLNLFQARSNSKAMNAVFLNLLNNLTEDQKNELRSGRSSWNTQQVNSVASVCSIEVCEKLGVLLMDLPVWAPELGVVIGPRLAKTDKARTFRGAEGNNWLHYCAIYPNLASKLVLEVAYPDTRIPDDVLKTLVNEKNGAGQVPLRLALDGKGSSIKYIMKLKDLGADPNLATFSRDGEFSFHSSYSVLFQFSVYALFGFNHRAMSLLKSSYGPKNKEAAIAAIEAGNAELLDQILSYTSISDFIVADGSNLLHYACGAGFRSVKVVECLLENKKTASLVNAENDKGETPLFFAMLNYSTERGERKAEFKRVLACLIKYDADEKKRNKKSKDCFEHLTEKEVLEMRALISQIKAEGTIAGPLCCYAKDVKRGVLDPNALFVKPDGKNETMLNMSLRNWPEKKALFQTLIASDKLNVDAVGSDGIKSLDLAMQLGNEYAVACLVRRRAQASFICNPDVQMLLNLVGKLLPYAPQHVVDQLTCTAAVQPESNPNVAVSSSTAAAALSSTSSVVAKTLELEAIGK